MKYSQKRMQSQRLSPPHQNEYFAKKTLMAQEQRKTIKYLETH